MITPKDLIEQWRQQAAVIRGDSAEFHPDSHERETGLACAEAVEACADELEAALSAQPTTDLRPLIVEMCGIGGNEAEDWRYDVGYQLRRQDARRWAAQLKALAASSPVQPEGSAERALVELWGAFCPDCGPENHAEILAEVLKHSPKASPVQERQPPEGEQ